MNTAVRRYDPQTDFMRVRRFLIDTFELYGRPFNWLIDRWNFTRYFVAPVHTFYNVRYFDIPTLTHDSIRDEVETWEKTIWVWETGGGDIAGAVHADNEDPGNAFFQVHPGFTHMYPEMLYHAEKCLADRGYRRLGRTAYLEYAITGSEQPGALPGGFVFRTVAEEDNVDERRRAKSISFGGNYDPSSWPPAWTFREMQKAPDYRPDLDLYIKAPNGECAAFCTIWVDEHNRYANFEPVGTRADYQRLGLGTALLNEGFRRMAGIGVTRSFMVSSNPFYRRVGFRETPHTYSAWMKYLEA